MSNFKWGRRSKRRLRNAYVDLAFVLTEALKDEDNDVDITIVQTSRSWKQHLKNLASKKSRTKRSKHIPVIVTTPPKYSILPWYQYDPSKRVSRAVDIAVYKNGKIDYDDIDAYCRFAEMVAKHAVRLNLNIRWGGSWKQLTEDFDARQSVEDYKTRVRQHNLRYGKTGKNKKKPLLDFCHFEINGINIIL